MRFKTQSVSDRNTYKKYLADLPPQMYSMIHRIYLFIKQPIQLKYHTSCRTSRLWRSKRVMRKCRCI